MPRHRRAATARSGGGGSSRWRPAARVTPALVAALIATLAAACSATLDWREVRPPGADLVALFPCRPHELARTVPLAGRSVRMSLHACTAGGLTWALAVAPLGDPTLVTPALEALRRAAAVNVGATGGATPHALQVRGATPNAASGREELHGRLADGSVVVEQLALFTRGTIVYQATVLGAQLPVEAADTFFGALKVGA